MAQLQQMIINGTMQYVRPERFEVVEEHWNRYILQDGEPLRLRSVLTQLMRVVDAQGKPIQLPDGTPWLVVKTHDIVIASE